VALDFFAVPWPPAITIFGREFAPQNAARRDRGVSARSPLSSTWVAVSIDDQRG
jgi:hypothetical protein